MPDGQAVAAYFWLADTPAVSQFTIHCPGIAVSNTPPYVICAEGAFLLFCITLINRSLHYFVYSSAGAGKNPSLHLLPSPDPDPDPYLPAFPTQEFGLLPCGEGHYAVAYLDWEYSQGETQYYASVFLSETNAWRRSKAAPLRLSKPDQRLFDEYACGSYKQIIVGDSAVGWVDLMTGILLACNLFDETPAMKFIALPASRACITHEDDDPYYAPEYFCDVVCSGDLTRFIETDFEEPDRRTDGKGWRATTWNMKLDWDDWRERCTVDVDDVSVERSYSAMLPELLDQETGQLELKKLHFFTPTLSMRNDNLLYMLAKVDQRDNTAWVIMVDMRRAVLEALVPVSTEPSDMIRMYCSCALPGYYPADDTVKTDDGSQDSDPMQDEYWRRNWCEESLVSWDFLEEEDEHENLAKEEEEDEDLVKKEDEEEEDEEEDPVIREEEECQAMETFFCHATNTGADMGNPVDNHDKSHEIWLWDFDPIDNKHQQKKKRRRKRKRTNRRKKKQAQAELLDLLRLVCCILMVIIVEVSIRAFPG